MLDKRLLIDWDYSKNTLNPQEVAPFSNKFAFWKCHKCGYEWKAKICNRSNNKGCPCCSHNILVPGINDLATTHPDLAKEWDYTNNGDLKPNMFSHGTRTKVWWVCPNGHHYQASIGHRSASSGTSCPICNSGRQTSFREQAFYYYIKKLYPNTISRFKNDVFGKFELDIFIPEINTAIEYDGVAWHKENKFEREKRKYELCKQQNIKLIRVKEKFDSNSYSGLADFVISVENIEDLRNLEILIKQVLDYIDVNCFCSFIGGAKYLNCPIKVDLVKDRFEIMKYATKIERSFLDVYPELAKEWHPTKNKQLTPNMFKPKSNFLAWWKCPKCGEEYEQTIINKVSGGQCPNCVKEFQGNTYRMNAVKKKGSISNESLLKEWSYQKNGDLKPSSFTAYSDAIVWWKCSKCGHEWKAAIKNRSRGHRCPCCTNRVVVKGINDLETRYPNIAKEWDLEKNYPLKPSDVVGGFHKNVWWKCSACGHEYQAPPNRRISQGSGCRACAIAKKRK